MTEPFEGQPWRTEQGEQFAVPDCVSKAEGIRDLSWHNDTCPSFGMYLEDPPVELRIWAEHPDPDLRESLSEHRFIVIANSHGDAGDELITEAGIPHAGRSEFGHGTDDAAEAVLVFMEFARRIYGSRRELKR